MSKVKINREKFTVVLRKEREVTPLNVLSYQARSARGTPRRKL